MEEGNWTLPNTNNKVEARKLSTNKTGSQATGWTCPTYGETITFTTAFNANPLVLSTRGSDNNSAVWGNTFQNDPATATSPATSTQMCIGLSQSKAVSPGTFVGNETIYWIAMDETNGTISNIEYEILWNLQDTGSSGANWINGYADPKPFYQSWAHSWSGIPKIIITGQTSVGGSDGSWPVLYDTGNTSFIRMFVDEANERAHSGSESGGGFAFTKPGYYPNSFPQILNPQFNVTSLYKNSTIKFNLTATDDDGNFTITSVLATFLYPNATKINYSLSQGYALSSVNTSDKESGEIQNIADKIIYNNAVKAETDNIRLTATQTTVNLKNNYDPNQTIISVRYSGDSTANALPNYATAMVELENNNTLNITRYSAATATYLSYSILEAQNIQTYLFNATWTSTANSITPTISPQLPTGYNTSCFVQLTRNTKINSADTDCNSVANIRGEIISNSSVRLDRIYNPTGCTSAPAETRGQVVCFKDTTKVTNFELYNPASTQADSYNLTSQVDMNNSYIVSTFMVSDDGVSQNNARFYFTDNDTISSDRGSASVPGTLNASVYVIEFENNMAGLVESQTTFLANTLIANDFTLTNTFDLNKTTIECSSDIRSGTGTNHNKNWWTYNLTNSTNIHAQKTWAGGSGQDVDMTCQAISWPLFTNYNTGSGGTDFTRDWTYYNNIDSTIADVVDSVQVNITISVYNNSGSIAYGNNNSDIEVELYTSSGWINIGSYNVNSVGDYSITTTNSVILNSWKYPSYRDVRLRGFYFDFFDSNNLDQINWTSFKLGIDYGSYTSSWELFFNDTSKIGDYNVTDIYATDEIGAVNNTNYSNLGFNVWSYKPNVSIIYPLNNTKIIDDSIIEFQWISYDNDSSQVNATIYFNETLVSSKMCNTSIICSLNISNVQQGLNNWSVNVTDEDLQMNETGINFFTLIYQNSKTISKTITSFGANVYNINTTISNLVNLSADNIHYEFVDSEFNFGSDTPTKDFSKVISGYFNGTLYGWNLTIQPLDNVTINYASGGISSDYNVLKLFIVGNVSNFVGVGS